VPTAEFRPFLAGSIIMKPVDSKYATGLDWLSTTLSSNEKRSRSGLSLGTELKINAHIVINSVSFFGKKGSLLAVSFEVKLDDSECPIGLDWLSTTISSDETWSRSGLLLATELKIDAQIVKNRVSFLGKWWSFRRLEVLGRMIILDTSCFATFFRPDKLQCSFNGKDFGETIKRELTSVRKWCELCLMLVVILTRSNLLRSLNSFDDFITLFGIIGWTSIVSNVAPVFNIVFVYSRLFKHKINLRWNSTAINICFRVENVLISPLTINIPKQK
jgi:hypothetical protein